MERILFGDNQFFGVNHVSDEKSRSSAIQFKKDQAILDTIDIAMDHGVNTFMCTTHERMHGICTLMQSYANRYHHLALYPCLPYAHKYANAVTELGIVGTLRQYIPGNMVTSLFKGGMAVLSKDVFKVMELLIDAEMNMFKGMNTPVIFLQNVVTDLLMGLGMKDVVRHFHTYVIKKYNAEPAYITMNLPQMLDFLEHCQIHNPIICSSINVDGFRMSGGKERYEHILQTRQVRAIAMQVLSGGATPPRQAIEYVCSLPGVVSILFGASSKGHIKETVSLIHDMDLHLRRKAV
jgi:hypothetical protein